MLGYIRGRRTGEGCRLRNASLMCCSASRWRLHVDDNRFAEGRAVDLEPVTSRTGDPDRPRRKPPLVGAVGVRCWRLDKGGSRWHPSESNSSSTVKAHSPDSEGPP